VNAEQNQRTEEREIYRRACVRAYRFGVAWSTAARTTIERYREALNELNGFPVPDKDTGSNIAHTLLTLTEEFERGMEQVLPSEALPRKVLPSEVLPAGEIPGGEGACVPEAAGASVEVPSVLLPGVEPGNPSHPSRIWMSSAPSSRRNRTQTPVELPGTNLPALGERTWHVFTTLPRPTSWRRRISGSFVPCARSPANITTTTLRTCLFSAQY